MFRSNGQSFGQCFSSLGIEKVNDIASFLIVSNFIKVRHVFKFIDQIINLDLGGDLTFYITFDLIIFAFEILQNCGFLNDIVGEFIPLHITISIDIDLIEQIC